MNSYTIPRELGDDNKFLIFSTKALLLTASSILIAVILGSPLLIMDKLGVSWALTVFWIIFSIFSFTGYALGTFKIPDSTSVGILKKIGGEGFDVIAKRLIKFYRHRKIYIYKREEDIYGTHQ